MLLVGTTASTTAATTLPTTILPLLHYSALFLLERSVFAHVCRFSVGRAALRSDGTNWRELLNCSRRISATLALAPAVLRSWIILLSSLLASSLVLLFLASSWNFPYHDHTRDCCHYLPCKIDRKPRKKSHFRKVLDSSHVMPVTTVHDIPQPVKPSTFRNWRFYCYHR